jgi:hypothetical protein
MDGIQATAFQPMPDRGSGQPQLEELSSSDDAVLGLGEPPDRGMKVRGRHSDPKASTAEIRPIARWLRA